MNLETRSQEIFNEMQSAFFARQRNKPASKRVKLSYSNKGALLCKAREQARLEHIAYLQGLQHRFVTRKLDVNLIKAKPLTENSRYEQKGAALCLQ
ncbi:hypothetical protein [Thalassotalea eurytherma]|uniref:DUF45 domain-containing protein n=1 Tax=Thalassotalea eurytherma TaxID=1144278 RepID=A0ABQ6H1X6_9GAMM|nr:hypothetical protein [Thalassotalea eurytherma]GLX80881.1 hypothetical protein theurythT_03330 [Thalassotalea eurytherma]